MLIEGVAVMRAVAAIRVTTREKLFVSPDVSSDRPSGGSVGRAALRFAGDLADAISLTVSDDWASGIRDLDRP